MAKTERNITPSGGEEQKTTIKIIGKGERAKIKIKGLKGSIGFDRKGRIVVKDRKIKGVEYSDKGEWNLFKVTCWARKLGFLGFFEDLFFDGQVSVDVVRLGDGFWLVFLPGLVGSVPWVVGRVSWVRSCGGSSWGKFCVFRVGDVFVFRGDLPFWRGVFDVVNDRLVVLRAVRDGWDLWGGVPGSVFEGLWFGEFDWCSVCGSVVGRWPFVLRFKSVVFC